MALPRIDCHQHVWSGALVERLRERDRPPRLRDWQLHLDGEPPYDIHPLDHDPQSRRATDVDDGTGLTLLALSSPLGAESLPPEQAQPLLDAWHAGADQLDDRQAMWAAPRLVDPDPREIEQTLAHPRVCGLQVPATALATPEGLEKLAPLLWAAENADRPVLVHPGPAPARRESVPGWWPALADYPAQLAAAWFAWHLAGRALLPVLRIGFAALGQPLGALDPDVFYETSSYGRQAVDAMTRVVGVDALVHGTDRPYAAPAELGLGPAFDHAVHVANPHRFLHGGSR